VITIIVKLSDQPDDGLRNGRNMSLSGQTM